MPVIKKIMPWRAQQQWNLTAAKRHKVSGFKSLGFLQMEIDKW